jgi:hypothetical protein
MIILYTTVDSVLDPVYLIAEVGVELRVHLVADVSPRHGYTRPLPVPSLLDLLSPLHPPCTLCILCIRCTRCTRCTRCFLYTEHRISE